LFLSIAKAVGETAASLFSQEGRKRYDKYLLHPQLSLFFSEIHRDAMRQVGEREQGAVAFHLGAQYNDSLIRAIIDDQLPMITTESEDVSIDSVLGTSNPRFPLPLSGVKEISRIVTARIRSALDKGDHDWLRDLREAAGLNFPIDQGAVPRVIKDLKALRYLLLDYPGVGKKIIRSKTMRLKPASYPWICRRFLDLVTALKRNECIQILKGSVEILSDRQNPRAEELFSTGSLYRFHQSGRIVNETRRITTVFLDLRGFTQKSEEAISAGELTDQLYVIFDPITSIVKELNGRIDKFTGDGMMVTFSVLSRRREDPLNALRLAIRVQQIMKLLRKKGVTDFDMGISIHTGIAFVANFFAGDHRVDQTVIGRNINIAGRLSSAGDMETLMKEKKEFDDLVETLTLSLSSHEERAGFLSSVGSRQATKAVISGVSVDGKGNLYNHGIVLSQQAMQAVDRLVGLQSDEDGNTGYLHYHDEILSRKVSLYYMGDVKFKGVESALAVYAVLL
jgi:class 3 adenylate cyclase